MFFEFIFNVNTQHSAIVINICADIYFPERPCRIYGHGRIGKAQPAFKIGKIKQVKHRQFEIHNYPTCVPQSRTEFFLICRPVMKPVFPKVIPKIAFIQGYYQLAALCPEKCADITIAKSNTLHRIFRRTLIDKVMLRNSARPAYFPFTILYIKRTLHENSLFIFNSKINLPWFHLR
ncbi:MAG TPA: hypothetical protein PLK08_02125 [Phycisphaerae bacterium]|nr:hypothetical protein [Phycisphaerae bacterium]